MRVGLWLNSNLHEETGAPTAFAVVSRIANLVCSNNADPELRHLSVPIA
jgi:hypothetical protein